MNKVKTKNIMLYLSIILIVALFGMCLAGCNLDASDEPVNETDEAVVTDPSDDEHFEVIYSCCHPAGGLWEKEFLMPYFEEIEERTDGRVSFVYYPGNALVEVGENYDALVQGMVDMAQIVTIYNESTMPLLMMFNTPGIPFESGLAATYALTEGMEILQAEDMDEVHHIMYMCTGPGNIVTIDPIRTLEDMVGKQIRSSGKAPLGISALGGTPISMTMPEVPEALQRGVVDGSLHPWEVLLPWGLADIINYVTETPFLFNSTHALAFNKEKWDSFPADIQDIITEVSLKHWEGPEGMAAFFDLNAHDSYEYTVHERGVEVIMLSDDELERWLEKIMPIMEEEANKLDERGLPGSEAMGLVFELGEKYNEQFKEYKFR